MTLRERLSWRALGHTVVDPRVDHAVMARVATYLYLSGGVLGGAALIAGQVRDGRTAAALGATVGSVAGAAVVLALFERLTLREFRLVALAGVGLVSLGVWALGAEGSPVWSLYLGIVFYAVYFFDRRDAALVLSAMGLAYAAVCVVDSVAWEVWSFTSAVILAAAVLVVMIKERIQALIGRLDEQARTDPLTGLLNRRGFENEVEAELQRAQRYRRPLALLSADIDRFKPLNDIHGHLAGDAALQRVAAVLRAEKRAGDSVARVGGDEFMILVQESAPAATRRLASRLQAAVEAAFDDASVGVTVSFGVATFPEDGNSLDDLYRASDEALYRAKGREDLAIGAPP